MRRCDCPRPCCFQVVSQARPPNFVLHITPLLCRDVSDVPLLRDSPQIFASCSLDTIGMKALSSSLPLTKAVCLTSYPVLWTSWSKMQIKALGWWANYTLKYSRCRLLEKKSRVCLRCPKEVNPKVRTDLKIASPI